MESELYDVIRRTEADHWWYVGRRRIVFDWVERYLGAARRGAVLDIGCGTGYNLEELRHRGVTAVGLDLSEKALSFCRDRGLRRLVQGDAARLPCRDAAFDVVLALDLIEHVEDDGAALAGLMRALKPGGRLIVFTPAFPFLWSVQDRVSHHYRRYTRAELGAKLRGAGYTVDKLSYANTLLFPVVAAGRMALRLSGRADRVTSENELHPSWSNGILTAIFSAERVLLRWANLPVGVSLLAVASRPA
jgi:SAM-dependent methyltransferase